MLRYILGRIVLMPITLLGVITLTFIILRLMPGDPVASYLGEASNAASVKAMKIKFGLDRPLYIQYLNTVKGAFTGNFGQTFTSGQPVLREIGLVLPHTLILAGAALLISSIVGIVLGIIAALKLNKLTDYAVMSISTIGISMPVFWFGLLLLLAFSYYLDLFPVAGVSAGDSWIEQLHALVLPALTVSSVFLALVARMTRSSMADVLNSNFITAIRAKGASEGLVIYKHALKNAMIPIVTVVGLNTGTLISGAVLTETVFSRPGIGKLLVDSVLGNDYPLVEGIVMFIGTVYIITNLIVDILYAYLDPRIKYR
jgi:ABC-type dipeptide/oligopeptide/nickel transport system permease component